MSGGRTAMAQSHSVHGGALSFMSCTSGRESSPLDESESHPTGEFKTETKKKKFHPLRNLRRMFRRKTRHSNTSNDSYHIGSPESAEISTTPLEQRSCSTSKLVEENGMQNLMKNNRLAPGLSLSHDSVFTPDRADSGLSSSDLENSSLSISNLVPPPTEFPLKSHSSCSESSLLSMDSSEAELSPTGPKSDLDLGITSYKLSHSAAKHKMAVKPRRNHGAPRSKRRAMSARSPLPSTPEVNEEAGKGFSPSATDTTDFLADASDALPASSPPGEGEPECGLRKPETDFTPPKAVWSKPEYRIGEPVSQEERDAEECGDVHEDDWGEREEEVSPRKEESFFGRLLSRRSEKKKKSNADRSNDEYTGEEFRSAAKEPLKSSRSVHRRQRVDPIEIPSSPSLLKKTECDARGARDSCNRMKISYSMSPPKTVLPAAIISRSSSPPKVVWPEHFPYYKNQKDQSKYEKSESLGDIITKSEARASIRDESFVKIRRDLSPTVSKTKETQKIIADEVESKFKLLHSLGEERVFKNFDSGLSKDVSLTLSSHEKNEADRFKVKSKEELMKVHLTAADETRKIHKRDSERIKLNKANLKSSSIEKLEVSEPLKSPTELFSTDVVITHEEPHYANLKNILPVLSSYEKVHHGYENVQVIELVKKEKDSRNAIEDKMKSKSDEHPVESPVDKKLPKFERPKSMRRETDGTPEFMKVQLNRVNPEAKPEEKSESAVEKTESPVPRTRSTLIERRKSELMLTNETEESDWKSKVKVLKKQTSFSESGSQSRSQEKVDSPKKEMSEKTETHEDVTEVVMRKKPNAAGKGGDDQPELMKVFARRSLKVRESEEIVEEMRRSRDSDKENENTESPKEERKKIIKPEAEEKKIEKAPENESPKTKAPDEVIIQVTPLKPEVVSRKCVFQKYGRAVENGKVPKTGQQEKMENGTERKTRKEQSILEENKSNKMKEIKTEIVTVSCIKEANAVPEEGPEETGFKRIQQRKAEWERRVQQAAK